MKKLIARLAMDKRITVWHISLYTAIMLLKRPNENEMRVRVSRKRLMLLSHINSIVTYHKCIRQLIEYGYIHYYPDYDHFKGTEIELIR